MNATQPEINRRSFLAASAVVAATASAVTKETARAAEASVPIVTPPAGKRILLSCKLGMITKKIEGRELTLVERLNLAKEAGFDVARG